MSRTTDSGKAITTGRRSPTRAGRKTFLSCASLALLAGTILLLVLGGLVTGLSGIQRSGSIPEPWLSGLAASQVLPPRLAGFPAPIPHVPIPDHPFMAAGVGNNMHCDAYMSDTYQASGPLGLESQVSSRTQGFGGYGTVAFDREGRIVAVHSNGRGFQLELMDPYTLEELAAYDLPPRSSRWIMQGIPPWKYLGAGMYFYLDEQGRAVVPTTDNTIRVVQVPDMGERTTFELVQEYDLRSHVVPLSWPDQDSVAWVLSDWDGSAYWYATTGGMVGTVDITTGSVRTMRLDGEIVENSFAVGEDGVYILSDYALYRFHRDDGGGIVVDWRTAYDRGPGQKPGHITRGSGTSVTLVGDLNGLAVISDNAEPRIHLLFVRRSDGAVQCSTPVFEAGRSGTDVSTAGFELADGDGVSGSSRKGSGVYSVLVENNWGHHTFPRSRPAPGLVRVDAVRQADGSYRCQQVWASEEKSIGVFKLSLGNGLAYMYWRGEKGLITQWYLTAIDWRTGQTVLKQRTGAGLGYNNWASALFIHPDGGLAYSTTIFGLVAVRDGTR
jgi:hypothetical protein